MLVREMRRAAEATHRRTRHRAQQWAGDFRATWDLPFESKWIRWIRP
jgi:hypothetical protein